eukprot:c19327_g1_i1 orf=1236-2177(-)
MSSKGLFVMKGNLGSNVARAGDAEGASAEWELRPGGMLVQKRDPDADAVHAGPLIRVKVSYGRASHHVSIKAHSTFGDLKKLLVKDTGLQAEQQRLLYKGKDKSDGDCLHEAGVKDKSKIVVVEDTTNWEKRLVELRKNDAAVKACKAVAEVQQLVDQISGQIANIEAAVLKGTKLSNDEFMGPSDLLMCQLIKLDANKVDGDAKVQKRILVRRVQKYIETLDALNVRNDTLRVQNATPKVWNERAKARNDETMARTDASKVRSDAVKSRIDAPTAVNSTVVTTTWETFGSSTASVNVKSALPANEPLLIQWD